MRYFDLHCDTMIGCYNNNKALLKNDLHIDLTRAEYLKNYIQCFAVWIPDEIRGDAAFDYFSKVSDKFFEEIKKNCEKIMFCNETGDITKSEKKNLFGAILTVENGSAIAGKLENIEKMSAMGVKMLTLTWNGENEIGGGILSKNKIGLKPFGKLAVQELEKNNIVIDISHASIELFYDVAEIAKKPFIASHSNSIKECSNLRNLTDEQFEIIKDSGGIVGINLYRNFLNDSSEKASIKDIVIHAEHFLSLGGENAVSIGGDLDGSEMPYDIKGIEYFGKIYEAFLRLNYKESLLDKIFYSNAADFFIRNQLL